MTTNRVGSNEKGCESMITIIKQDYQLSLGVKKPSVEMLLHHIASQAQLIENKLAVKINDEISQVFLIKYNEVSKTRIYMTSLQKEPV